MTQKRCLLPANPTIYLAHYFAALGGKLFMKNSPSPHVDLCHAALPTYVSRGRGLIALPSRTPPTHCCIDHRCVPCPPPPPPAPECPLSACSLTYVSGVQLGVLAFPPWPPSRCHGQNPHQVGLQAVLRHTRTQRRNFNPREWSNTKSWGRIRLAMILNFLKAYR